jgi:hypothetical protein
MKISLILWLIIMFSTDANGGEDLLLEYWKRPIQSQIPRPTIMGAPKFQNPKFYYPEACGECHKEQYNGWKESLHGMAVGPGLLSQLAPHNDPETAVSCYYCHAPMEEQMEVKKQMQEARSEKQEDYIKNPYFDNKLKLSGVSCAVCHLREGRVYGPPLKSVSSLPLYDVSRGQQPLYDVSRGQQPLYDASRGQQPAPACCKQGAPVTGNIKQHNFVEKDFFEKAEFCAACHQMDGGYELNGKVLTNTYREWKDSFYGKNNITCQSCHMPDRQHLWKGIHDTEMVKGGIGIEVIPEKNGWRLVITNSGVGHFFPTYVTPLIIIKGFMMDKKGKVIQSSLKEAYIGRKVSLDLETEFFDTRIAPQKSFEFDYNKNLSSGDRLVFEVWVYPDKFYNEFFKNMLKRNSDSINKKELEDAYKNSSESGYLLWKKEINLG